MSTKNTQFAIRRNSTLMAGSFAVKGNASPTDKDGDWFTVARSGTGEYTVTLTRKFASVVPYVSLGLAEAGASVVQLTAVPAAVGGYLTFKCTTLTEGSGASAGVLAAADIAAAAGNRVYLQVIGMAQ